MPRCMSHSPWLRTGQCRDIADLPSMFGVQDASGQPGYSQRDHDTGPLKYIIRGPDDDYNEC